MFQNREQAVYEFNILIGIKYNARRLKNGKLCIPPLEQKGILFFNLTHLT